MATEENFSYNPGDDKEEANYDEAIMAQQREIEKQIADSQPLVGDEEDFTSLEREYAKDDVIYQQKIIALKRRYKKIRRTRKDGNCFYRAFGFAYLERLLNDKEEFKRFFDVACRSKDDLVALGFPQFTIEDFHDTFMEVLDKVDKQCSVEDLQAVFNDQGYSDYLVVYLRLLVSGHLQKESEFYENFVEGGRTVKEFCNQEVEPMAKESDHIHIIALTTATSIPILVEYMDRGEGAEVNQHTFPEGADPYIHMLYRPGHYDILYK